MALTAWSVANRATANSFVDVAYADNHFAIDVASHGADWLAITDSNVQERLLITATRMLMRQKWKGTKAVVTDALDFPRSGLTDKEQNAVDDTTIPDELKEATAELALAIHQNAKLQHLESAGAGSRFQSMKFGKVSFTRTGSSLSKGGTENRFPKIVQELVGSWLGTAPTVPQSFGVTDDNGDTIETGFEDSNRYPRSDALM